MADALLIDRVPGARRAALIEDGRLAEIEIIRDDRESLVGQIFLGRVQRVLPGGHAAFVALGGDVAGYLPIARGAPPPHEGAAVMVQVAKDALGTKGPQLATRIALAGRFLVLVPGEDGVTVARRITDAATRARLAGIVRDQARPGENFTARTAAAGADEAALAADAQSLRATWAGIEQAVGRARAPALLHAGPGALARLLTDHAGTAARIVTDDAAIYAEALAWCVRHMPEGAGRVLRHRGGAALFEAEGVAAEIERSLAPRVALPSGGEIVIEPTEALVAIDVNTASLAGTARADEAALRTNLEAAGEAARQLRLRALGGLVVIDFVTMDEAAWRRVLGALGAALARDRVPVRVLGRTNAGLVEVTRARTRAPLASALAGLATAPEIR